MKLIKLNDDFCLLEKRREVERRHNRVYIEFSVERIYGTVSQEGDDSITADYTLQFEEKYQPEMWQKYKNMERDQLLEEVLNDIQTWIVNRQDIESGEIPNNEITNYIAQLNFEGLLIHMIDEIINNVSNLSVELIDIET